jgi:predicted glycosyltransferase
MDHAMTRRILFYVQHLLGVGHLARASHIARAAQGAGMQVTLVTGGLPVPGFPGADIPHVALPPVAVGDGAFSGLVDEHGHPVDQAFLDRRRDLLLAAFHDLAPDVVVTEAFPFGRRQVRFELLPLLDAIRARPDRPAVVASVRDILQRRAKPIRDAETVDLVRGHYDLVMVHGDPAFASLADTFGPADRIADRVAHTGLVCGPPPAAATEAFDVIVSAGGGAVGQGITMAAVQAAAVLPEVGRWLVIMGPNMAASDAQALADAVPPWVTLARFRTDFRSLLGAARLSVSQAGYNTVGDVLRAGCRSILVPYAAMGETEQSDRAARLAAMGRALVIEEGGLTGPAMAHAIARALAMPEPATLTGIATDGAAESARLLAGVTPYPRAARA